MRRQPIVQAFLALVAFWLAASVPAGGRPADAGSVFGSVHAETHAVSSPHATIGGVATTKKVARADWSSRPFLPSRGILAIEVGTTTPQRFPNAGLPERGSRTVTYDATAPPAVAILNTVR